MPVPPLGAGGIMFWGCLSVCACLQFVGILPNLQLLGTWGEI